MIYPSNKASVARTTEKVSLKGQRIVDLGNQRVLEKRMLAESNFSKKSESALEGIKPNKSSEKKLVSKVQLSLNRAVEIAIAKYSPLVQSQSEYVTVLEKAIAQLKSKLKQAESKLLEKSAQKPAIQDSGQFQSMNHYFKRLELEKYYNDSRKLLLTCSMELIDCKALLLCQQPYVPSERVESIGTLLHRNEMLLKTYNYYEEEVPAATDKVQQQHQEVLAELEQLRQITCFQEKTIQQLKTIKPVEQNFDSERRLLRHEINRLFKQNEKLRKDLEQKYGEFFERVRTTVSVTPQSSRLLRYYFDIFSENNRLREDVHSLTIEKNYIEERLIQEKDCSGRFAEELKRVRDGQSTPVFREEDNPQLELLLKTVSDLREKLLVTETLLDEANARLNEADERGTHKLLTPGPSNDEANISFSANTQISPIPIKAAASHTKDSAYQALTDQLSNQPALLELFHKYSADCEVLIGSLKEDLETERQDKQRTLRWCKKTYQLLKSSNLPQTQIEAHLHLLYELDNREKYTRVRSLLRDIEGLAEGFDRYERKEVEQELSEYVSALKKRGNTIRQVDNEDGSSVMINDCQSEAFTDMERLSESEF